MEIRYGKEADLWNIFAEMACIVDELQMGKGGTGHNRASTAIKRSRLDRSVSSALSLR